MILAHLLACAAAAQTPLAVKISQSAGGFGGQLKSTQFGTAVEVLGDVDGDGIPDLAVGAPGDNANGPNAGAVWILFLEVDGSVRAAQKITAGQGGFEGQVAAQDRFGFGLAAVGDLDDDGTPDVVVSAPNQHTAGSTTDVGSLDGFLAVLFLGPDGRVLKNTEIRPSGGVEGHISRLGSMSGGVQRVLVQGVFDEIGSRHGAMTVLRLQRDGTQLGNLAAIGIDAAEDRVGRCVEAGDLDRDGTSDLICGGAITIESPGGTRALVVDALAIVHLLGSNGLSRGSRTIDMEDWEIPYHKESWRTDKGPSFVASTAGSSTLSGLIVGAPTAGNNTGAVVRVFLNERLEVVSVQHMSQIVPDLAAGTGGADRLGRSVAVMDLDGNGLEEILVGTPSAGDGGVERGVVWVLFNPPLPAPAITSAASTARAVVDKAVSVESHIYDLNGVDEAVLHFRRAGDRAILSSPMTLVDDTTFVFDIPAYIASPRGIEYFVTASNESGAEGRWPAAGFASVPVEVPEGLSMQAPSGTASDGYRLVSIPLDLDETDATTTLEASLGTHDLKRWRFFQWIQGTQEVRELGQYAITLRPGNPYWLLVKDASRRLTSGPGTTIPTAEPFRLGTGYGWNLVANPYAFPVRLNQITNATGRTLDAMIEEGPVDEVLTYQGDWVAVADTLQPFEGYAVYISGCIDAGECDETTPGALYVYSDAAMIPATEAKRQQESKAAWSIRIAARQGAARDETNVASVSTTGEVGRDRQDRPEPPVIGDHVSVSFPHPEWHERASSFRQDTRPSGEAGYNWPLEVRSRTTEIVQLSFEAIDSVPEGFEVWLIDPASGVHVDLRQRPEHNVVGPGEGRVVRLTLAVGTEAFLSGHQPALEAGMEAGLWVYPNPFQGSTTVRYVVETPGEATVSVYDVLGRRVRLLSVGAFRSAGAHAEVWDGRSDSGSAVAGGLYFVVVEAEGLRESSAVIRVR